jgi:hypothetical protein
MADRVCLHFDWGSQRREHSITDVCITFYKRLLNYVAIAQSKAFVPLLTNLLLEVCIQGRGLISGYDSTRDAGVKRVGMLVSLTLYFPRRSTVQESTTSLPTGVVRFPIARPNSGSSGTSLVVLHVSETETQATSVTRARWWSSQGVTWSHEWVVFKSWRILHNDVLILCPRQQALLRRLHHKGQNRLYTCNTRGDSKLLSGFLWPVVFKLESTK